MSQSMPGLPKKRDVSAHIRISMFDNRVEIVSPGGLPRGVTTEDYLSGNLSILRNPVLASVFFRLGIIEQFGTGIRRIKESYARTGTRPRFEITGGSITVILPVTDAARKEEPRRGSGRWSWDSLRQSVDAFAALLICGFLRGAWCLMDFS